MVEKYDDIRGSIRSDGMFGVYVPPPPRRCSWMDSEVTSTGKARLEHIARRYQVVSNLQLVIYPGLWRNTQLTHFCRDRHRSDRHVPA